MREEISVLLAKAEAQQRMYSRGRPSNQVVDALVEMLQRVKYELTAQDTRITELEKERDEVKVVVSYLDAKITSASNCHERAIPLLLDEALNRTHLDFHREALKEQGK